MKSTKIHASLRFFLACLLLLLSVTVKAQSSGDRLYSQGLEFQKKQTVQDQRNAISKFRSAKRLYDSDAKKKQCDDAIKVSENIINNLQSSSAIGGRNRRGTATTPQQRDTMLRLATDRVEWDCAAHNTKISVTCSEENWTATPLPATVDFVKVTINSAEGHFEVSCTPNETTDSRQQQVEVSAGSMSRIFTVLQEGKPTILRISTASLEFTSRGGTKSVDVFSNSSESNQENNYQNWRVESKPDWLTVVGETPKQKNALGRVFDKVTAVFANEPELIEDPNVVGSVMKIVVNSKVKNSVSRTGEVIISSGNQQVKVVVLQK